MNKARLSGPLGKAVLRRAKDEDYAFGDLPGDIDSLIDELPTPFEESDLAAVFRLALRGWVRDYLEETWPSVQRVMTSCKSPIEHMLLAAIMTMASQVIARCRVKRGRRFEELRSVSGEFPRLTIMPQHEIGEYRVDFLIELEDVVPDFDHPIHTADTPGGTIPGTLPVRCSVVVE